MPKALYIKTWGCQMNEYDSTRMVDVLAPLGYERTDRADGADLVILNTCHIREKAAEKLFSELGRLRPLQSAKQKAGGRMVVAVAGCVAQAEGEALQARAGNVDLVFGPQTYHRLPELLSRIDGTTRLVVDTEFPVESKFDRLPEEAVAPGVSAYLSVQEGCDKFCSFCVVPYTRGAEFSRPVAAVLAEAERLVARGAKEITLLGQNVNAFHGIGPDGRPWSLGRLIRHLAEHTGVLRLRYTTSHPLDVDEELVSAHRDVVQLMPFLHLPVQSGSDRVLAAMNRKHTADQYRCIIDTLRTARPDLALSSDFIVGFPGETDRDFAETLRLVDDVGFVQAYSFKYSPRPGTPAAALGRRQVPDAVKAERLVALQERLNAHQRAFNRACLGRRLPVLFDRFGRRPGQILGRSPAMQSVHVEAPETLLGHQMDVEIQTAHANSLGGVVVPKTALGAGGHQRLERVA